jgi:hypothetical protein
MTRTFVQDIVAVAPDQRVCLIATVQLVVSGAANDMIAPRGPYEMLVANSTDEIVVHRSAGQAVVSGAAERYAHLVIGAREPVRVPVTNEEKIVVEGLGDGFVDGVMMMPILETPAHVIAPVGGHTASARPAWTRSRQPSEPKRATDVPHSIGASAE